MNKMIIYIAGLIAAALLMSACSSTQSYIDYKGDILQALENKNSLKQEKLYDSDIDKSFGNAGAVLFQSVTTNCSKYFEKTGGEYGAIWICRPEEAFEKFHSIAQSVFFLPPEPRMIGFGVSTNYTESVDLLKTGQTEYYAAKDSSQSSSGKGTKLSLYMFGNDAVVELAYGPSCDYADTLSRFPGHPGVLYPLFKEKLDGERREIEYKRDQESQRIAQKNKQEAFRREIKEEDKKQAEKAEADRIQKQAEEVERQKREAARQEKWEADNKARIAAEDAREAARQAELKARIEETDRWVKRFNPGYHFSGRTADDFLKGVFTEGKKLESQIGEVFEITSRSWEIMNVSEKDVLVHHKYRNNSTIYLTRTNQELLIVGQPVNGFIALIGTRKYTTVSGTTRTVPLFEWLDR